MSEGKRPTILIILALVAIIVTGALYADKFYVAPEAPPNMIWTIKGQVELHDSAQSGDLITAPNLGSVYYLNQDMERMVFPDEQTFLSWYENFDDVKTIPQELLESFPLSGKNMTIRPGTFLVTIPSSSQVWMISEPDVLMWLSGGEEQVVSLFGPEWRQRLVDLPEYYYGNYTQGADIIDHTYPIGAVLRYKNQRYVVRQSSLQPISDEAFGDGHYQERFVVEVDSVEELEVVDGGRESRVQDPGSR